MLMFDEWCIWYLTQSKYDVYQKCRLKGEGGGEGEEEEGKRMQYYGKFTKKISARCLEIVLVIRTASHG